MMGITFRDKHSARDIGVAVKTVARPVMPPPRIVEDSVPYEDGNIDFSELGGRVFYDDKVVEIEISIVGKELTSLHRKISKVAGWLSGGYGYLIFDDMPYTVWIASPVNTSSIAPELQKVGKTTVQFRCRPFNRLLFSSLGIPLDSYVPLDSDIPIGYGDESIIQLKPGMNKIEYDYIGTAPTKILTRITGTSTGGVTIFNEAKPDKVISYQYPFNELFINSESWVCIADEKDVTEKVSGDYGVLEFSPGINSINVMFTGIEEAVLQFDFFANYLYKDERFTKDD